MSEENMIVQSDDSTVNDPSTKAGENNDNVSQDVFQKRISKISSQKNEAISKAEALQERLDELEAKDNARLEEDRIKNGEMQTILNEQKQTINTLTNRLKGKDEFENTIRKQYLEKLPEEQRTFGEDLSTPKLMQFVDNQVQSIPVNAGKLGSDRQGVNPSGEFGGYSSPAEWASQDPDGYKASRNPIAGPAGIKIAYE